MGKTKTKKPIKKTQIDSTQDSTPSIIDQMQPDTMTDVASMISPSQANATQQALLDANMSRAQGMNPASGSSYNASSSVTNSATNRTKEAELYDQFANAYNQYQLELQKQREFSAYGNPNSDMGRAIANDRANFTTPYAQRYVPGGTYTMSDRTFGSAPARQPLPYEKPLPVTSTTTGANTVSGSVGAEQRFAPQTGFNPNKVGNDDIMVFKDVAGTKPETGELSTNGASFFGNWARNYSDAISGKTVVDANGNTTMPSLKELPIKLSDSIKQASLAATKQGTFSLLDSNGKNIIEEKTKASMANNPNLSAFFWIDRQNGDKLKVNGELLKKVRAMYIDKTNAPQQLPAFDAIWDGNKGQWTKTISKTPKELTNYLLELAQWAGQSSVGKPGDSSHSSVFSPVLQQDIITTGRTGKQVLQQSRDAAVNELPFAITFLSLFGDEFAPNPSTMFRKR